MFGRPHFGGVAFFCAYAGPKNIGKTKKKKKKLLKSLVRKEKLPHICVMRNNKTTTMSYKELTRIAQTGYNETIREMARQALKDLYPTNVIG